MYINIYKKECEVNEVISIKLIVIKLKVEFEVFMFI